MTKHLGLKLGAISIMDGGLASEGRSSTDPSLARQASRFDLISRCQRATKLAVSQKQTAVATDSSNARKFSEYACEADWTAV